MIDKPTRKLLTHRCLICLCPILERAEFIYCIGCVTEQSPVVKERLQKYLTDSPVSGKRGI